MLMNICKKEKEKTLKKIKSRYDEEFTKKNR